LFISLGNFYINYVSYVSIDETSDHVNNAVIHGVVSEQEQLPGE